MNTRPKIIVSIVSTVVCPLLIGLIYYYYNNAQGLVAVGGIELVLSNESDAKALASVISTITLESGVRVTMEGGKIRRIGDKYYVMKPLPIYDRGRFKWRVLCGGRIGTTNELYRMILQSACNEGIIINETNSSISRIVLPATAD